MKSGVSVTQDELKSVMEAIEKIANKDVLVGIPQEAAERKEGAINNASLGYIHEHGAPVANIPARPFLIPGVREAMPKAEGHLRAAAKAALDNKPDQVSQKLNAAGMVAQNTVKAKINSGIAPALKDSTKAARARRGRTGDVPLIDTGSLRNSINYVVREK